MRCYNGAPDSALQRYLDEQSRLHKAIKAKGDHATYFPNGEFYQVFDSNHLPVGRECKTLLEAANEVGAS